MPKQYRRLSHQTKVVYNRRTGMYELMEDGILYAMPLELTVSLNVQLNAGETVRMWYNSAITKEERNKVIVIDPNKMEENNGFYSDIIPE